MNLPADIRLTVTVLDILAGENLRYRSDRGGYASRAEKAAHRVMEEPEIARWTGEPGAWYVASESRKAWHLVSAPELVCDCEDAEKGRQKQARSGICHHIIVAAFCEAGRLEAERERQEARAAWDDAIEERQRVGLLEYLDAQTVASRGALWQEAREELAQELACSIDEIEKLFGPAA